MSRPLALASVSPLVHDAPRPRRSGPTPRVVLAESPPHGDEPPRDEPLDAEPTARPHEAEASQAPSIQGDRAEFERAIAPAVPGIYRFCLALCRDRAEADDLLQETLVRAFLHRASFEGRSQLFSWLCGIARNQFLEARRVRARRATLFDRVVDGCRAVLEPLFSGDDPAPDDPERSVLEREDTARLHRALHGLPEEYRLVVLLCDIEEMTHEQAAKTLGVPVGTVKSRQARGRARLATLYRAEQPETESEETNDTKRARGRDDGPQGRSR